MEQVMQASAAVTPPVDPQMASQAVTPQVEGQQPLGVTEGVDPNVQLTEPQEQWIELETGARYRTVEDLKRGAEEKDRFIRQLMESRNQQPQPQTQVDPQAATNQAIAQLAAEIEQDYRNDPKFQGASPEAIAEQAYIDAKRDYRNRQWLAQQQQQQQQEVQWQTFIQSNPDLQTPLARQIHDSALASGYKFPNPQAHLDAVHAEMYRQGIPRTQSNGVTGAMQNVQQQRQIFGNPVGGSQAPSAEVLPPHVQQALIDAQKRGESPADVQRIKEIAMGMNISRFNKSRGFNQ